MKQYVVANWKCHKSLETARRWFDEFARVYRPSPDLQVIIAPSFIYLQGISEYVKTLQLENVYLAAQDVSPFPLGNYTGAIAADMLRGIVDYVMVGHSERRRYFRETSQDITNKVSEIVEAELLPLVFVDQPYAMSQLTPLASIDCEEMLIAYGSVEANRLRIPEKPQQVDEAARFIANVLQGRPVLYGGSLYPDNITSYSGIESLAGVCVGAASLEAESLAEICQAMAG